MIWKTISETHLFLILPDFTQNKVIKKSTTHRPKIDNKINEVDHLCDKNDKHVDNLRELNKQLLDEIKNQVEDELEKQAKMSNEIKEDNDGAIQKIKEELDNILIAFHCSGSLSFVFGWSSLHQSNECIL